MKTSIANLKILRERFTDVVICATMLIAAPSAQAAFNTPAALAIRTVANHQECAVRPPSEAGNKNPQFGVSRDELLAFAAISPRNELWVRWYLVSNRKFDTLNKQAGMNVKLAILNPGSQLDQEWHDCEEMRRFIRTLNRDLYTAPKMVCTGGPYTYNFQVRNGENQMALQATTGNNVNTISRDVVKMEKTGKSSCPLLISQSSPDAKALKMCIPLIPKNEPNEGAVVMKIDGHDLPYEAESVSCLADMEYFNQVAKVPTEAAAHPAGKSDGKIADVIPAIEVSPGPAPVPGAGRTVPTLTRPATGTQASGAPATAHRLVR